MPSTIAARVSVICMLTSHAFTDTHCRGKAATGLDRLCACTQSGMFIIWRALQTDLGFQHVAAGAITACGDGVVPRGPHLAECATAQLAQLTLAVPLKLDLMPLTTRAPQPGLTWC